MQRLEVSSAVRLIYKLLGFKRLSVDGRWRSNGCSAALRWLVDVIQSAPIEYDDFQVAVLINLNMEIEENRC